MSVRAGGAEVTSRKWPIALLAGSLCVVLAMERSQGAQAGKATKAAAQSKNVFEVHQILLPMNGTYILENMDTAELAKDKAYEFLFVLGQPRFKGGVQSMINPVAIR